ncbi:hypothetical protein E4T56_gene5170 [Termitomyces sp. T112]|nr:hypothetical protein E4T56_gene5170 [Termitomyces sp. T112]
MSPPTFIIIIIIISHYGGQRLKEEKGQRLTINLIMQGPGTRSTSNAACAPITAISGSLISTYQRYQPHRLEVDRWGSSYLNCPLRLPRPHPDY